MNDDPSSVHNTETPVLDSQFSSYGLWRRQAVESEWLAAHAAYSLIDQKIPAGGDDLTKTSARPKADILESCRTNAWFSRHKESGEVRVISSACHLRWCPVCSDARRNFIGHQVGTWIKSLKFPKLLTFTMKHSNRPLSDQVTDLYGYFKRLRKRNAFNSKVLGGIWFFQIKLSKKSKQWHPHFHCVVDGEYIPKRLLQRLWIEITTESLIVDIASVKDPDGCALEVARYASKPGPLKGLHVNQAAELIEVMHGRRICGTWGIGRKVPLRPPRRDDKDSWESLGSWVRVMSSRRSDRNCEAIFESWRNRNPLPSGISCYKQEARDRGEHVLILTDSHVLDEIYDESWCPI